MEIFNKYKSNKLWDFSLEKMIDMYTHNFLMANLCKELLDVNSKYRGYIKKELQEEFHMVKNHFVHIQQEKNGGDITFVPKYFSIEILLHNYFYGNPIVEDIENECSFWFPVRVENLPRKYIYITIMSDF